MKIELKNNLKELSYTSMEFNILSKLDDITDKLYTLNSEIQNYFKENNLEASEKITKNIEQVIDIIDNTYLENIVTPICKRAIVNNFNVDEFQEQFEELCSDCGIQNQSTLVDCALDIFEKQYKIYQSM